MHSKIFALKPFSSANDNITMVLRLILKRSYVLSAREKNKNTPRKKTELIYSQVFPSGKVLFLTLDFIDPKRQTEAELESALVEVSFDIDFLEAQVRADRGQYSPAELERATGKIAQLKQKEDFLRNELANREP
ncbi:MAG: hypothetical protein ACHQ1H_03390 [Nitrososphaerales archaeon]